MVTETAANTVRRVFTDIVGAPPQTVTTAPGRVNLIGDHTDYNDGFVLPMALPQQTAVAGGLYDDSTAATPTLHCTTLNLQAQNQAVITDNTPAPQNGKAQWWDYIAGVYHHLRRTRTAPLASARLLIKTDVPIGAGLSSSAALELSVLRCLCELNGIAFQPIAMAKLAQQAECEWVGTHCGIMDQLAAAIAPPGSAVLIDCRSLAITPVPIPASVKVVVMDTGTRRSLNHSAYNERRRQCEAAAQAAGVASLRDLTAESLAAAEHKMDATLYRRARHVVSENARVLAFHRALTTPSPAATDPVAAGKLLNASHRSLANDYEVSSDALNAAVAAAVADPACYGARMTGAGFAGCAVAFTRPHFTTPATVPTIKS